MTFDYSMLNPLLETLVLALIAVLVFFIRSGVAAFITYMKSKIGETNFSMMSEFAVTMVQSLEQNPIFKEFAGDKKKELALVAIKDFAKEIDVTLSDEMADRLIEAAVKVTK